MRRGLKYLSMGLLAFFLTSCGPYLSVDRPPSRSTGQDGKRVVVLPFADYTPYFSTYEYWVKSDLMMEVVNEELMRAGWESVERIDVLDHLLQKSVIRESGTLSSLSARTEYIRDQLADGGWNEQMQGLLEEALLKNVSNDNMLRGGLEGDEPEAFTALDRQMIKEIGTRFGGDYIIRGRVVAFSFRKEESFYPNSFRRLYFFFPMGAEVVFGISDSGTYEVLDMTGSPGPMEEMLLTGDTRPVKAGGYYSRPVVRLSMIIHDAKTGDEVWKDRVDVRAARITTTSNTADREITGVHFDRAVRKGTKDLIARFISTTRAAAAAEY